MEEVLFPRSPRETMDGWIYLPRYIDKLRLHLAGKLPADYQDNLGKGFDGAWLKAAGISHEQMVEVVKHSITDGQVCDWVRKNIKKSPEEKAAHAKSVLGYPTKDDAEMQARLKMRKEECGAGNRDEITTFVDLIDVDEGRL